MEVPGAAGNENGSHGFHGGRASVQGGSKVLEADCEDGCSAIQTHLTPSILPSSTVKTVNFVLFILSAQFFKLKTLSQRTVSVFPKGTEGVE